MTPRFNIGDRVKIRRSWSEEDGALGTIADPPDAIRKNSNFGTSYFKEETTLTGGRAVIYWVELDASNFVYGSVQAGEYDDTELEKL